MSYIQIKSVSKIYESESGEKTYALNNVSLSFPNRGLIGIVGKSGSGKSTLINILSSLDKPDKGEVLINGKKISKLNKNEIGIIFQHYYLIENESVLFNIMLPSLILGNKRSEAYKKAILLLEKINFPINLYHQKCADLSGGEKERVAILRALINDPTILLCDEPTGALDSENSIKVMEILKDISKDKLVILVSHNMSLTNLYADRIITLSDGKVKYDERKKNLYDVTINKNIIKRKNRNQWSNKITLSNFKKRFTRNLISMMSLFIGLVFSILIFGFSNGSESSIIQSSYKQFDYGVLTLSNQYKENISGSKMSLVKETRPTFANIEPHIDTFNKYEIENNFDALIPPSTNIFLGEEKLDVFTYKPIYSFLNKYVDKSLLINGYFPGSDNLNEVIVNKKGYEYLLKHTNSDPLNFVFEASFAREFHYSTGEIDNPTISDVFSYKKYFHIVGVVEEMDFLNTPRIYYSYSALVNYLFDYPLNNLSNYLERNISWYERVATASNGEELSSYSFRLFLKDINDKEVLGKDISNFSSSLVLDSIPYSLGTTLLDLVKAATMGMEIFLFIALFGSGLILGIVSFSSYSEDRKNIAILTVLGAKRDHIMDIYNYENIIVSLCSLFLAFLTSPFLAMLANKVIFNITGFSHMIEVPFIELSRNFIFLIITMIISTIFLAVISTCLPIIFAGKISLKKELADE